MIGKYKSPDGTHHGEVRLVEGQLMSRTTCCGGTTSWIPFRSTWYNFGPNWTRVNELPKESDIEDT